MLFRICSTRVSSVSQHSPHSVISRFTCVSSTAPVNQSSVRIVTPLAMLSSQILVLTTLTPLTARSPVNDEQAISRNKTCKRIVYSWVVPNETSSSVWSDVICAPVVLTSLTAILTHLGCVCQFLSATPPLVKPTCSRTCLNILPIGIGVFTFIVSCMSCFLPYLKYMYTFLTIVWRSPSWEKELCHFLHAA